MKLRPNPLTAERVMFEAAYSAVRAVLSRRRALADLPDTEWHEVAWGIRMDRGFDSWALSEYPTPRDRRRLYAEADGEAELFRCTRYPARGRLP